MPSCLPTGVHYLDLVYKGDNHHEDPIILFFLTYSRIDSIRALQHLVDHLALLTGLPHGHRFQTRRHTSTPADRELAVCHGICCAITTIPVRITINPITSTINNLFMIISAINNFSMTSSLLLLLNQSRNRLWINLFIKTKYFYRIDEPIVKPLPNPRIHKMISTTDRPQHLNLLFD
jgi:hypothetical protein